MILLAARSSVTDDDDVFTRWKRGDWQACLPHAALHQAQTKATLENIHLALQIKHAIGGFSVDDLVTFHDMLNPLSEHVRWSRAVLRLLCAHLQLENPDSAHDIVLRFLTGRCPLVRTRTLQRFPLALQFLIEHYPEKLSLLHWRKAEQAVQLADQIDRFDSQLIKGLCNDNTQNERKQTVAIVGNGPSLLDKTNGQFIDCHDVVIRFNNPVITENYQRYTGQRTDLLIISPDQVKKSGRRCIKALAISGINILQGESGYWTRLVGLHSYLKLAVFDQANWYSLVKELKAPPSAGLLAISSLASQKNLEISVFGFTKDDGGASDLGNTPGSESGSTDGAHYGDTQVASTRHNWPAEAAMVRQLVDNALSLSRSTD